MKLGDVVHGYSVVTKPTNQSGGKCLWAFAEKDGKDYFLKQFLDPKWPLTDSPGSEEGKAARRRQCKEFEARHRLVMKRLRNDTPGGGNIVVAQDFFREGATYYKVTERIDPANISDLTGLSPHQQAVVLRTLALSVQQLHRIGIVHGDLKTANILVQQRPGSGLYTAKLIDFDDSYVVGEAPGRAEIGGDQAYGPPEWHRYLGGDESVEAGDLGCAVDMFCLGVILHEYLAGERPGFDTERFDTVGSAVNAGEVLVPGSKLGAYTRDLVVALTHAQPSQRPTIDEFIAAIDDGAVFDPSERAWSRGYHVNRPPAPPVAAPAEAPAGARADPAAPTATRRWSFNKGSELRSGVGSPSVPGAGAPVPRPPRPPHPPHPPHRLPRPPPPGRPRPAPNRRRPFQESGSTKTSRGPARSR